MMVNSLPALKSSTAASAAQQLTPGQRLKFILQQHYGTLKHAAEELRLNPVTLSSYATDRVSVQIDLLQRLSKDLNMSADWIVSGIGTPYNSVEKSAQASAQGSAQESAGTPDTIPYIVRALNANTPILDDALTTEKRQDIESNVAYAFAVEEVPSNQRANEASDAAAPVLYRYVLLLDPRSAFPLPIEYSSAKNAQPALLTPAPDLFDNDPAEAMYSILRQSVTPARRLYCLRDDSMLTSGLVQGALLLVDEAPETVQAAQHDDIVVSVIEGKFVVRRLAENSKGQSWLESGHPDYPRLTMGGAAKTTVRGTMIAGMMLAKKYNRFLAV